MLITNHPSVFFICTSYRYEDRESEIVVNAIVQPGGGCSLVIKCGIQERECTAIKANTELRNK